MSCGSTSFKHHLHTQLSATFHAFMKKEESRHWQKGVPLSCTLMRRQATESEMCVDLAEKKKRKNIISLFSSGRNSLSEAN